jgi:hypothetical protein
MAMATVMGGGGMFLEMNSGRIVGLKNLGKRR